MYWYAHIRTALDDEHNYVGRVDEQLLELWLPSVHRWLEAPRIGTMQHSIEALLEATKTKPPDEI